MRRRLALAGALAALALTACTPEELQLWQQWHDADPGGRSRLRRRLGVGRGPGRRASRASAPAAPQGVWDQLADCESGGDWSINTGNGYSGGLQFLHSSWRAYGGEEFAPLAYQATRDQQIVVAERILDDAGWDAWPTCSSRLGLG